MNFGEIFGKSWREYKSNFWSIFIFMSVFVLIPSFFVLLVNFSIIGSYQELQDLFFNPYFKSLNALSKTELYYYIFMIFLTLATIFLSMIVSAGILKNSLTKEKYIFRELRKEGISSLGRFLLITAAVFAFLLALFLLGMLFLFFISGIISLILFFLLAILGAILIIYWIFGAYVLFDEKKGIFRSLRRSMEIVRGRWWRILGYAILLTIIMLGISIASSLITLPGVLVYMFSLFSGEIVSAGIFIFMSVLDTVANFVGSLLILPLSIIFFKNLYIATKKESSINRNKKAG